METFVDQTERNQIMVHHWHTCSSLPFHALEAARGQRQQERQFLLHTEEVTR
jgi:hypothetical protein